MHCYQLYVTMWQLSYDRELLAMLISQVIS